MIKAVFLDLDNTLLHNPDHQFAKAFLDTLEIYFQQNISVTNVSRSFRQAIQALNQHRDLMSTNAQIMVQTLSKLTKLATEQIQELLSGFYEYPYSQLQQYTKPIRNTQKLIRTLLQQDIRVAIATNPLYPQIAILKRLQWAGLEKFTEKFAFITHSENMHSAKPKASYYAEAIARVGIEPDETLMIGDSLTNDINPSQKLGIRTFHMTEKSSISTIIEHVHQENWQSQYIPSPLTQDMIIPQYEGNIAALYGLLSEVKANQWTQRPNPAEWSILQILSHLVDSEIHVQRNRLQIILEQNNPFIIAPPPPTINMPVPYQDGYRIVENFVKERMATITLLEKLSPKQWQRPARHNIFGMTTLLEMAYFTAQHDRLHINQLCQTLGKCD